MSDKGDAIQQVLAVLSERHQGHCLNMTMAHDEYVKVNDPGCGIDLTIWFDGDVQPGTEAMQAAREAAMIELSRRHRIEFGRLVEAEVQQSIGRQLIALGLARPIV